MFQNFSITYVSKFGGEINWMNTVKSDLMHGKRLSDSESEDVAYQSIALLQWMERHYSKRTLEY